jgi:hypothetical protein
MLCLSSSTTIEADLGGCQRVDHVLRGVGRPVDDVDALAGEFVGHRGDARAAQADAGADRVDARVVRDDGDLGAQAGVARGRLDLEQAFLDLGHFEFEQLHDEFGCGARQHDLRAAGAAVDAQQVGAHAVADAQVLAGDHLVAVQEALDAAGFDDRVAAVDALDDAVDEVLLAGEEVLDDLLALGIADFLQDDLLGGLRADAAELDVFQRLFDVVADLDVGDLVLGVDQQDLVALVFQVGFGHHLPAAEGLVVAGFAVDRHAHVGLFLEALLGGGGERLLQGFEHDFLAHVLFARQRVGQH